MTKAIATHKLWAVEPEPSRGTFVAHVHGILRGICDNGLLEVELAGGEVCRCEWLQTGTVVELHAGDRMMVALAATSDETHVVIGRIGNYTRPKRAERLVLEADRELMLHCGQSSIELRADGKVLIRGEDVLVRAKGTKRIRAGTVSIN